MTSISLAEWLRPKTLDDVSGRQHLPGPGKPQYNVQARYLAISGQVQHG